MADDLTVVPEKCLPQLQWIKPDVKWFMTADDGAIDIRYVYLSHGTGAGPLSTSARAALALTEICCERRKGKVYYVLPPQLKLYTSNIDATAAFKAVPELFYVPEAWSEREAGVWEKLAPLERLRRLTSRYGWVDRYTPIVPFTLELQPGEFEKPHLDGLSEALITVYISPYPFVGLTADMRAACKVEYFQNTDKQPGRRAFTAEKITWEPFKKWRVGGGVGILEYLDKVFRDELPRHEDCVWKYGDILYRLVTAGKTAAGFGHPYGLRGQKSQWV